MKELLRKHFYVLFLINSLNLHAQFYNGHQMNFGKNRVQYNDFYWSFYRFEKFDIYFNQDGKEVAIFTGKRAAQEIYKMEEKLNHTLKKQLIFLVYNKFSDFKQSNIGLVTGKEEYNIGGVTKIRNNKVSLYFQGNHQDYMKQLRAAIAEVIVLEMLYGNKLTDNFASSTMLNLPEWYLEGITSYLSEDWSTDIESKVRDGITNNRYDKFNRLTGPDAIYAGHSFWKYINDYYGGNVVSDIIYITKVNKGANSAILNVLGVPFKELTNQWLSYYKGYFEGDTDNFNNDNSDYPILKKQKASNFCNQVKASPDGEKIAYVSNNLGQYKVFIFDTAEDKSIKILKYGHKIKQINDYTYPVIEWHPSGKILTIITEKDGGLKMIQHIVDENKRTERNLLYFDKILAFSYSPDGTKLVFSAVKDSKTDIYIYDIASATSDQITNDIADDFSPRFIEGSNKIIFSSNRLNDSIQSNSSSFDNQLDLFTYDYQNKNTILKKMTNSPYENEVYPFESNNKEYYYLNDKNGVRNLYHGKYDSSISYIDTAIHYRYFLNEVPQTNYSVNIDQHHLNQQKNTYSYIKYNDGKYQIYKRDLKENVSNLNLQRTKYRILLENKYQRKDSIANSLKGTEAIQDSSLLFTMEDNYVDINRYLFEIEKPGFNYKYNNIKLDSLLYKDNTQKIRIYQRTFFTDHIVSQVDFGFLNSTYQAFTGGAIYFNPGINALLKIGAYDLLEDYKIIAGVRFSADFNSNEYLVSLENLKKKIDEQFVYHRQSFENTTSDFISTTQTNKLMYIRTLPFSQVSALKGTFIARHDRQIYLSTDRNSLQKRDINKLWAGIKFDYIFDNTVSKGVNLYNGTRYKIFGEYYKQVNKTKTDLFVFGTDLRHYQKIHRDLILAARFAASTSFGNSKLIYYLGGVDNWTNFSQKTPTFIPLNEIPINEDENYAYQAAATNLRGFPQNIRNGNSFALINAELRCPVIKYFANYPLNSMFWSNFQVIGFFDIGSAWSGISPYGKENAYDKDVTRRNSITITLDTERDPIVAGYGYGLRAMLFGYFIRFDWAWGIENQQITPRIFYFSLSLDF